MIDLTSDASQPYTFAIIDLNINCLNYKVDDIVLFCCFVSLTSFPVRAMRTFKPSLNSVSVS